MYTLKGLLKAEEQKQHTPEFSSVEEVKAAWAPFHKMDGFAIDDLPNSTMQIWALIAEQLNKSLALTFALASGFKKDEVFNTEANTSTVAEKLNCLFIEATVADLKFFEKLLAVKSEGAVEIIMLTELLKRNLDNDGEDE